MNSLYQSMLSAYDLSTTQAAHNAACEVSQQIVLSALSRAGFFDHAAFYGGTCLRIMHGLERYSEDMDFTLLAPQPDFDFAAYFRPIIDEFALIGRKVEISRKEKQSKSHIESAFLKDNTDIFNLTFQTAKSLKIKIEVDTCPPLRFTTEFGLLLQPRSCMIRCLTLPNLFAGKMHALVFRTWRSRVKGRDWYDFEWYVRHSVPLNFEHLQERIRQFNGETLNQAQFLSRLKQHIASTDIALVKQDVLPFVKQPADLDIWSTDYFLRLADRLNID